MDRPETPLDNQKEFTFVCTIKAMFSMCTQNTSEQSKSAQLQIRMRNPGNWILEFPLGTNVAHGRFRWGSPRVGCFGFSAAPGSLGSETSLPLAVHTLQMTSYL